MCCLASAPPSVFWPLSRCVPDHRGTRPVSQSRTCRHNVFFPKILLTISAVLGVHHVINYIQYRSSEWSLHVGRNKQPLNSIKIFYSEKANFQDWNTGVVYVLYIYAHRCTISWDEMLVLSWLWYDTFLELCSFLKCPHVHSVWSVPVSSDFQS